MAQNIGTLLSAAIRPNDSLDPIASAFASEIKGGFHTTTSTVDRNAIIVERREWGMMCYVVNDNKTYQLTYGYSSTSIIDNNNWKEFSGSGSGSGNEWLDSVISVTLTQPGSPTNGDRYLVGREPSDSISWGTWSQPGFVAQWNSTLLIWDITIPTNGMSVRVDNEDNSIYRYEGIFDTGQWEKEMMGQIRSIEPLTVNGTSYSVTMDPPIGGYIKDMILLTQFNITNTGATISLNINGMGEVLIKKYSTNGLVNVTPQEIDPSFVYSLTYDGTYLQMVKPYEDGAFDVKYNVESTDYIIVPQYYQYWVYGDLTISGYMENYGNVIIMNGGLVLTGGTFSNFGQLLLTSVSTGATTSYNNSDTIQFSLDNTIFGPSVSATIVNGSITQSKLDIINSGTAGSLLAWTASGEFVWIDGSSFGVGGIAGVTAGNGLTGGGGYLDVYTGDYSVTGLTISSVTNDVRLTDTGVVSGVYGGSTSIPQLTIDSQGRITSASTASIDLSSFITGVTAGNGLTGGGGYLDVYTGDYLVTGLTISSVTNDVRLTDTGVVSGVYGGSTSIPQLTIDSQGRVTSASTASLDLSGGLLTIAIGPAEDGDYTDGIFTDFTSSTLIGTAVDRFNEMLLLLAPTPPSNWNNAITSISFTSTSYSSRTLTAGSSVTVYTDTTPDLTNVDTVSTLTNAKVNTTGLTFSLIDQGVTIETVTLAGTATPLKSTGNIRHSASGDPYTGVSGKAGFWTGITDFSLSGSLPVITPSSTQRTLQLYHPGTDSPETFTYYIDSVLTVSIGTITASVPSMTSYISGVPTLTTSNTITSIGFSVSNVSSYFYAATSVYQINAGLIAGSTGDPNSVPTSYGETGNVTGKSGAVQTSQFSDTSFSFTVRGRNSIGTYGSNTTFTSTSHRVDTVSVESSRKTSGSGSYPASGYNGTYDSTQSLVGTYTEELQLRNGIYVYPSVNYTTVGGPNYSGASGTRWATFNLGTFTSNSAFTLNINGSSGISSIVQANLLIEVKIDGATFWVDGDAAYSGTGNPGSVSDGVAAVVISYPSTSTSRRITFGTATYTGSIIVRIGFTGTGPQFTSLTATSIV